MYCTHSSISIEFVTTCYDAQLEGFYKGTSPVHLTFLAANSKDYAMAKQHLH